jgi:hypothetical protein
MKKEERIEIRSRTEEKKMKKYMTRFLAVSSLFLFTMTQIPEIRAEDSTKFETKENIVCIEKNTAKKVLLITGYEPLLQGSFVNRSGDIVPGVEMIFFVQKLRKNYVVILATPETWCVVMEGKNLSIPPANMLFHED